MDAIGVWNGRRGVRPVETSWAYDPRTRSLNRTNAWDLLKTAFALWSVPPNVDGLNDEAKAIHKTLHAGWREWTRE